MSFDTAAFSRAGSLSLVASARTMLVLASVVLAPLLVPSAQAQGWQQGRATHYTSWGSGGNKGACSYGTLGDRFPLRRQFAAWPGNDGAMCGKCVEVKCDPRVVTDAKGQSYGYTPTVCKGGSVVVLITDDCPCGPNSKWCCGDQPHLDLSMEAFSAIAQDRGIMATMWRVVDCPGSGFQKPGRCNTVLKGFEGCGSASGPYQDKCCGEFMSCQKKTPTYWQCVADEGGAAVADMRSAQPASGGGSTSDNRRKRQRNPAPRPKPTPKKHHQSAGGKKKPKAACHKIANWHQCGGLKGPARNGKHGRDGLWNGYCCKQGYHCRRFNSYYWQCSNKK